MSFYAILRSCPNKLGGTLGMLLSIIILFFLPILNISRTKNNYSLFSKIIVMCLVLIFLILMYLGGQSAGSPFLQISKVFTLIGGLLILFFLPIIGNYENVRNI
jgi:ubiquinol-cytochrome c reductase cytochrome b subunit